MNRSLNTEGRVKAFQIFCCGALLTACFGLSACTTAWNQLKSLDSGNRPVDRFERRDALLARGSYEEAFRENERILSEGRQEHDVALFNMGVISAYSQNPKKDYPKALSFFRKVVKDHPGSPMTEQAKAWIQVLEEHQKIAEEKHKLAEDKRILTREKEALVREKELLSQEKEKLRNIMEKSRQVDIDIEKRRRQVRAK